MSPRPLVAFAIITVLLTPAIVLCQQQASDNTAKQQVDPAQLLRQIQDLLQKQQELQRQIEDLQRQLEELKAQQAAPAAKPTEEPSLEELLNPEIPQESESPRSAVTVGAQSFNPDVAVVGDFIANLGDRSRLLGLPRHDTLNRHIELAFSQRISPEAKAVVKWAYGSHAHWVPAGEADHEHAHAEGVATAVAADNDDHGDDNAAGEWHFHEGMELEEAYIQFDRLFPRLMVRIGRERLPFMKYNLLDGHELPFSTRPIAVSRFFGPHGLIDDGIRLAYLLPTSQYLSLELGVYNGRNDVAFAGRETNARTLMGRLHGYTSWNDDNDEIDWNLGWLHGDNRTHRSSNIYTADATYQHFRNQFDRYIVSAGYVHGDINTPEGSDDRDGYYLQLARRWDRYRINELGLLFESADSADPYQDDNWDMYSLYYNWHRTERVRFRLQYSHLEPDHGPDDDMVFFQTTYVMGTHPPHD